MDVSEYEAKIAALERENRILQQKLIRSEDNRIMLEEALETHSHALKMRNMELEASQKQIQRSEAIYRVLAFHDTLTGLPNRTFFLEQLNQAISKANHSRDLLAIFFIDLDKFKPVNDIYGHATGDKLLIEVGRRLRASLRENDTIARIGGDEFAALLKNLHSKKSAESMAQLILHITEQPFVIDERTLQISASIGASLFPDDGMDLDTLLQNADSAMYMIKKQGCNGYKFYGDQTL